MLKRFWAVLTARNIEFIRDRSALAWNFMFPVIVVFGFAFAFSGGSQDLFKVALMKAPTASVKNTFTETKYIQFVLVEDLDSSLEKLRHHQYDMVLSLEGNTNRYWINDSAPKGYLLERMLTATSDSGGAGSSGGNYHKETVQGREIRYVDWLISGLLAMNMMFSALFGVGYNIVRYRKNGVLKRLKATPLLAFEFLSAQVVSRLILLVTVTLIVYCGCNFFLHFAMLGSYLNLFLLLSLGSVCLVSLGLLVAARIASEEFAGGILNLISWPMMFLSGVWFSLEGAHPLVKQAAQIFPLTHIIDGARAVMTEGAGFEKIAGHLIVLTVMTAVFLIAGSASFKWE
jgi:ABC-type multidrug transport system permease subunit